MAFNLINFKKGTLSGLETLKTNNGIEEGTFYLTIDNQKNTSRLFIGTAQDTALPVNSNIITVTNKSELTDSHAAPFNDGDFAYVTNGNILAVKIGSKWQQINTPPGDNDYKYLSSADFNITTTNGVATIQWDGLRSDNQHVQTSMTMEGSNGVTVSSSGDAITISGDPVTLASSAIASNATNLTLSSTGNSASGTVAISGGTNVTLSGNANNIVISATDTNTTNSSLTFDAGNGDAQNPSSNGFYVSVLDSANNTVKDAIDPTISILTNEAGTTTSSVHFINGEAALDVYSKDEINRRLKAIDGMTYKGTVGTGGSAGTSVANISNPAIGDTFKVISTLENIPISGGGTGTAKNGDLLIANGTESNGVITSGTLYYDIVPAGDDTNQTYSITSDTYGIKVHDDIANSDIGGIKLVAGNDISLSESGTSSKAITVAHETMSSAIDGNPSNATAQSQTAGSNLTINAVTGLTTDNGHVTAVTVTPYTVVDTNATLSDVSNTVAQVTTDRKASVKTAATLTSSANNAHTEDDTFTLSSDNLTVTADGTNKDVKMNFVWGTF